MAGTDDPDPRGVVVRPGLHIPAAWIDAAEETVLATLKKYQ